MQPQSQLVVISHLLVLLGLSLAFTRDWHTHETQATAILASLMMATDVFT